MAPPDGGRSPSPWADHQRRAEVLRERYPFARQVLGLYVALLGVWRDAWHAARADPPEPGRLARWAAGTVLPAVVVATEAAGPDLLAQAARDAVRAGGLEASLAAWLAGSELSPVAAYLARASLRAPLIALEAGAGAACAGDPSPRGDRRCPRCGGPPQLSVRSHAGDPLVSGGRRLVCARCGHEWRFSSSTCPCCGETSGSRRTLYAEPRGGPIVAGDGADHVDAGGAPADPPTFPHLRIEACASCRRYLIDVDLGRDHRAVAEVDEMAALPLDLYASDLGLSKITPNLMGF